MIGDHWNTVLGGLGRAVKSRCASRGQNLLLRPRFFARTCGFRSKNDIVAIRAAVLAGNARANEASWPEKEEKALRNFEKYS